MRTLILGGARSGKSRLALEMAREAEQAWGQKVCFIATAQARDEEMNQRIRRHREERPAAWRLVEEPLDLARAVVDNAHEKRCLVVDCLTLWLKGGPGDRSGAEAGQPGVRR